MQKSHRILKVVTIVLWGFILLGPILFIGSSILEQFITITLEGKGDSGRERSTYYPFICYEQNNFTDRGYYNHCDYKEYLQKKWNRMQLLLTSKLSFFNSIKIYEVFGLLLVFLVPLTIYTFYKKE